MGARVQRPVTQRDAPLAGELALSDRWMLAVPIEWPLQRLNKGPVVGQEEPKVTGGAIFFPPQAAFKLLHKPEYSWMEVLDKADRRCARLRGLGSSQRIRKKRGSGTCAS